MEGIGTVRDLGATIRGHRRDLGWSQTDLAERSGVSRSWLVAVERGKRTAEVGLVLSVLDSLGLRLLATPDGGASPATGEPTSSASPIDLDTHLSRYRR